MLWGMFHCNVGVLVRFVVFGVALFVCCSSWFDFFLVCRECWSTCNSKSRERWVNVVLTYGLDVV